jgi:hypothetical protein
MSGKSGNSKADTGVQRLSGIKVQTTALGRCVPWVFGTNRVAPNLIQHDDFTAIENRQKQGGKGGGGVTTTSYTYKAAVIQAVCRGPISGIGTIWSDKEKHSLSSLGLDLFTGTSTQAPHPHWATNHPEKALAYRDMAYVAKASMDLGSGGSLARLAFEVKATTRQSDANPDARVDAVITALVTDTIDGVGLPASKLGDLTQLANFCGAAGIFISPAYDEQQPAKQALERLAEIAQCGMYWSDGRLKFQPYADQPITGNGFTFAPSTNPVPVLGADDFLARGGEPPIKIVRRGAAEAKNHFQIRYRDRAAEYNPAVVESKDMGGIERFGLLSSDPEDFDEICVAGVAQKLADFRRDRAAAVRTTYQFRLSMRWDRLEPTDIVALDYEPDGLVQRTVRVTSIEEDDDGTLTVEAEDCPLGAQQVINSNPQTPTGGGVDYSASPGPVAAPVIFEAPLSLTGGTPEVWIATSGGPLWGGAEMHISSDGNTYERVSEVKAKARHGALTAPLPAGGLIDTANTAAVVIAAGDLSSGTTQDATDLTTLCWVDGELLAYRDATLTGAGTYNLQHLVRGAHGTDIAAHATGGKFLRIDDAVVRYPYDRQWVGRTIWLKFTSRNIFGSGQQSLADVPAYTYTITGAPLAGVQNLALLKPWTGTEAQVKWDLVDGAASYDVEVQVTVRGAMVTARSVSAITSGQWTYAADDARADGGPWRSILIRVRPRAVTGKTGPWRSITASNPQIGALSGLSITGGIRQALFQCARPVETDFAGLLVWVGTSAGFVAGTTTLAYDGPDTFVTLAKLTDGTALVAGTTYYLRAAGYDEFGKDGLTLSSELTFTVAGLVPDVGSIIDTMLADGAITRTKFAQGLEPVSVVTSATLPTVKTTETITWGGKLYTWDGTAYTNKVPAVNITGQLTDAQLAQVSAAKIAGQLTDAQLAQISAAKIAGLITDAQLAQISAAKVAGQLTDAQLSQISAAKIAGQITDAQIAQISTTKLAGQVTNAQIAAVDAAKMTGQITGTQITDNAISTPKIAAGAVTAATIAAGAIVAGKIAAQAITAAELSAGAVTAQSIAAGAVTAGKIAAQAVTAAELSAGAVTAQSIAAGAVTAGKIAAQAVTAAERSAGAVQAQHIAAGSVVAGKIAAGAVTTAELSAGAVQAQNIAAGAIVAGKIAAGAVTATELAAGSVLAGKIAAGAVVAGTIAAGAVTAAELSAGAVTATKIAAGAVTADSLAANSVTAAAISAGAVRADQIAAGAVTAKHLLIADLDNLVSNGKGGSLDGWYSPVPGGISADVAGWWVDFAVASKTAVTVKSRDAWFGARFAVKPGDQFWGRADTVPSGGGVSTYDFRLGLVVFDAAGAILSFVVLCARSAGAAGYIPISGSAPVPSSAAFAQVWASVAGPNGVIYTAAGQAHHATNIEIRRKNGGELIVDGSITAAKILAGEVQTQHLVANAVTADKIVANSITADKIAVGAVQAQHISSGLPGGNLIPNSALAATFIDSGGALQADGHTFAGANIITGLTCSLNLAGDAWRPVGMNALALRQLGDVGAGNPAAYADIDGPVWPVVAGQPYEFSFYSGAHRCSVTGYVTFRNAAGTIIWQQMLTTNAEEAGGGQGLDGYKRLFVVAVASAGAVTGQLSYRKLATVAGASDSWLFATCPMGAPALSAAQSAPSPWVPTGIGTQISGGIIKTGTVTADRIGVSQLSAISANLGSINAGSLNINNRFIVAADGSTTIRSATSGQRTELDNQQMRVYDAAGVMRVRLGIW